MKRILFAILLLLVLNNIQAQRRRTNTQKTPEPQLPQMTVEEALAAYDFESAEQLLNYEITTLKKEKKPTIEQENKLQWLRKAQIKLNAVERVTFVDSLIVPRNQVLDYIQLSSECGSLVRWADFFQKSDTMDCVVFKPQMEDQIYFSQPDARGMLNLYVQNIYSDGSSSEAQKLTGISNDKEHQNYPFMLMDGATIYFGAQGPESLGGYDIFMSRYDAEEHRYLTAENIGMPFNSPANDYLYCIDETNNLGWFVTDRNTSADSVCIYIFIPNETRNVYLPEEIEPEKLRSLARITSIRDTQTDENALRSAQFRLREARSVTQKDKSDDFDFLINDNQIYHKISDFQSTSARQLFSEWMKNKEEKRKIEITLQRLRNTYHNSDANRRMQLQGEILMLENSLDNIVEQLSLQEKEIRKLELGL